VEETKLRGKEVSSTENMLLAACVEIGKEVGGLGRGVSTRVENEGNLL